MENKVANMNFGQAIEALKEGKKEWCRDPRLLECFGDEDELLCLGSIRMYTHDSSGRKAVLTGWLASQSDMLSEDWYIVE